MTPGLCAATVTESTRLGAYRVLTIEAPDIAAAAQPGQFVTIALQPGSASILRRPFSVYRADPHAGTISVAFDAIGSGTQWIASRRAGDALDVAGPLGNGFTIADGPGLVVGGGYGTAALVFLAEALRARGGVVHAIVGARSADRLFADDSLERLCESVSVTTDDGSAGIKGFVTHAMDRVAGRFGARAAYACGPMPMLAAVARAGHKLGLETQLAVEEFMACGVGVCWTCVIPVRTQDGVKHVRACTEGPVFDGGDVAWA